MIYGRLKEKKENSAVYYFGMKTDDMTGEVKFYAGFCNPKVIKYPTTGKGADSLLRKLAVKYKSVFSEGKFPEKISYEC